MKKKYLILWICSFLIFITLVLAVPSITGKFISKSEFTIRNMPPELAFISNITVNEGDFVRIIANATDLNGDSLFYNYSLPFNESGEWQTDFGDDGNYTINVSVYDYRGGVDSQLISVVVIFSSLDSPDNVTINILSDNQSVFINWSSVEKASDYVIYYSDNVSALINYNTSNGDLNVYNFTTFNNSYLDISNNDNVIMFYRIASRYGSIISMSDLVIGKQKFILYGVESSVNINKKKNWVSLVFMTNYSAENILQDIPYSAGTIIEKLIRISNTSYTYFPHIKGLSSNNFLLRELEGYNIEVNQNVNYTYVGRYNTTLNKTYSLFGLSNDPTNNPNNKKNWIGVVDDKGELAEDLISDVTSGSIIEKLLRTSNDTYQYVPHFNGLSSNNYEILLGSGYNVEVTSNVIYER